MDKCVECGYDRFWVYPDKITCQNCGAQQFKLVFIDSEERSCPVCTRNISHKRSDAIFCSTACRQKWHRAQQSGHWQNCQNCGKGFESKRPAKTCSPKCRKAASRVRAVGGLYDVSDVPVIEIGEGE